MGFGTAFANAWNQADSQINEGRRDRVKMAYDKFIKDQDRFKDAQAKDAAAVAQAHAITNSIPGVPEEAFTHAYEMLTVQGLSPDKVFERLSATSFKPIAPVASPEAPTGIGSVAGANPLEQQTEEALTTPEVAPTASPEANQGAVDDIDLLGNPMGPDGLFGGINKREGQRAQETVLSSTGTSPEDAAKYAEGYKPESIVHTLSMDNPAKAPMQILFGDDNTLTEGKIEYADAMAESLRGSTKPEDMAYVAAYDAIKPIIDMGVKDGSAFDADFSNFIGRLTEEIKPVVDEGINITSMTSDANELYQLALASPEILTETGKFKSFVQGGMVEIDAALNYMKDVMSPKVDPETGQTVRNNVTDSDINMMVDDIMGKFAGDEEQDQAYRLYQAGLLRLTFKVAKTVYGQTGQGLSNADFQRTYDTLAAGNKPELFKQNITSLITSSIGSYTDRLQGLTSTNPEVMYGNDIPEAQKYLQGIKPMEEILKEKGFYEFVYGVTEPVDVAPNTETTEAPSADPTLEYSEDLSYAITVVDDAAKAKWPDLVGKYPNGTRVKINSNGTTEVVQ